MIPALDPSVADADPSGSIASGLREVEENLYVRFPETLVVLTAPKGVARAYTCTLSCVPQSIGDRLHAPDHDTASGLRAQTECSGLLALSAETLTAPDARRLTQCAAHLPLVRVLLLASSLARPASHHPVGVVLGDVATSVPTRVAILALTRPLPTELNERILHSLKQDRDHPIFPELTRDERALHSLRSLALLSGALSHQSYRTRLLINEPYEGGHVALVEFIPNI
jgi:hypothetical protein